MPEKDMLFFMMQPMANTPSVDLDILVIIIHFIYKAPFIAELLSEIDNYREQ